MQSPLVLDYGKLRASSKRSAILAFTILAICGVLVWCFYDRLVGRIAEAYADRRYDKAFTAAWSAAQSDDGLWSASANEHDGDAMFFDLIDSMPQAYWKEAVDVPYLRGRQT